jgi:hypothetical protein
MDDGEHPARSEDLDLAALFAATPSPLLVLDRRFVIRAVNRA